MSNTGLALSGGGFRATLYHLGVIRYLRDSGGLQHVSDIAAVSGGSILAAHLALNDDPDRMGGFYTMLQYGVLFPLGGLGYQPGEITAAQRAPIPTSPDTGAAHTMRWYMGILF